VKQLSTNDWADAAADLQEHGAAVVPAFLTSAQCAALAASYAQEPLFRSRVVMARHGYGRGEYQYFRYPLPPAVQEMRTALYTPLSQIANQWNAALGMSPDYPDSLPAYLARCHDAQQTRPTPLLLRYHAGDYNCLHRDLYGQLVFPLQVTVLLSAQGKDFEGGEFVLTEQRPRAQSRVEVVPLAQGDAVIFPVHHRPVASTRGMRRVSMRHGVSRLRRGERYTLGLIFHDAA
jgi:hypothetical protein